VLSTICRVQIYLKKKDMKIEGGALGRGRGPVQGGREDREDNKIMSENAVMKPIMVCQLHHL
jgi:hypothetical protein